MSSTTGTEGVWSPDSYEQFETQYREMAGRLVTAAAVGPDDHVLDIGTGTGNVAITATRRGATVTGVDIAREMLDAAEETASRAGVDDIEWRHGDAADLPFEDDSFDVTVSALGHMYGDPPSKTTAELRRVTKPGGRVGITAWASSSVYPAEAGVLVANLDPSALPDFTEPPFLWGDESTTERRLGGAVVELSFETRTVRYPTLSPQQFVDHQLEYSELFASLFEAIDADHQAAVFDQLVETVADYFFDEENVVEAEYLLTTATLPSP